MSAALFPRAAGSLAGATGAGIVRNPHRTNMPEPEIGSFPPATPSRVPTVVTGPACALPAVAAVNAAPRTH